MPETFTTRQLAVIASSKKRVQWLFRVTDNLDNIYYWSTGEVLPGLGTRVLRYIFSPNTYSNGEWDVEHSFKIINFNGISLRRSKSESGINAPNDVSFTITNSSNTLVASNFKGGTVRIALVVNDDINTQIIGAWRFNIKSASPYNQQIDIVCEDFLQKYLKGSYPNTPLVSSLFPATSNNISDGVCVPEPYGVCYVPLRSVYVEADDDRYYMLGASTDSFSISKIRSPRQLGTKIEWTNPSNFIQSTKIDSLGSSWRVFQPIIVDDNNDGTADTAGFWLVGDSFLDTPTKFSKTLTVNMTNPADIIRRVLINMGISDLDLDGYSFDTARSTFNSWGLTWNFAFWYKKERNILLSELLNMCHSCLIVGEKLKLQVLSSVSVKTITSVEVIKENEDSVPSFKYTDYIADKLSDSGYIAWQQTDESQDSFLTTLVPAKLNMDFIDSEKIEFPAVQDTQHLQKLGTLYYQKKFLKIADIQMSLKGTSLIVRPDDVITINYADFGGNYEVLVEEVNIKSDLSIEIDAIKFSYALDDWADLSPSAIVVSSPTVDVSKSYSPIISGPDSPGLTNPPNTLNGRLKIGSSENYILLEPASPLRISLYDTNTEIFRVGNLNTFLDYVTNIYGIALGNLTDYIKYDISNGLRISGSLSAGTISIGTSPNWFRVDSSGNLWIGAIAFADATFSVTNAGVLKSTSGTIGGWTISATTIVGGNVSLGSAGYVKIGTLADATTIATTNSGFYADNNGNVLIKGNTSATNYLKVTGAGAIDINATSFNLQASTSGSIGLTATAYGTGNGVWLSSTATTRFRVGNATASRIQWNDTDLQIYNSSNALMASFGTTNTIAGWTLSASRLYNTHIFIDNTGEYISFGDTPPTAYGNNVGAWLGYTTGAKLSLYSDVNNYFQWDGAKLLVKAANFTLDSSGNITATSVTLTGIINADTGYFGGSTNGWVIASGSLTAKGASIFQTSASANTGIKIDSTSFRGYNGTVQTAEIATNGSGWFGLTGTRAIEWTTAGVATIAGYTATTTALYAGTTATRIQLDTTSGIHLGATAFADAPFRVSLAGALVATSATITGVITSTSGTIGGFTLAANQLSSGTDADFVGLSSGGTNAIWVGDSTFADAKFSVTSAGVLKAISGTIGGCTLASTSIGSTTFVSGVLGSGWNISNGGVAEFQDIRVRGVLRTSVFEKDTISAINGIVLISKADVLNADMTALDASTVTILGETTFVNNEVIRIKDGVDDEWMLVTNAASAPTYTVTRDLASSYGANSNPIWKKGTAVVSMGVGTGTKTGYILLDSSSSNSPYIDIYSRNSNTYTDTTLKARLGWLQGITDADVGLSTTDVWGLYSDSVYLKGVIIANTGKIGGTSGWTIAAGKITSTGIGVATAAGDATYAFWAGDDTPANAEFRVSHVGALVATSATITGAINADTGTIGGSTNYWNITAGTITSALAASLVMGSTGSTIKLGAATDIDTGIGFFADGSGNIRVGSATLGTEFIKFALSALTIKSSTFTLQASTSGSIGLTATAYDTGDGVWLSSTATTRFRVGNAGASRMQWDDTNLEIYNSSNAKVASFGATNTMSGWTINATSISATNITLTPGAANTANITVGTGSTAGGLNSANTGTDIAIWAGDTFANRATAPFRVTAEGALTATNATISGLVSGSYIYGSSLMTKGTYLTVTCTAGDNKTLEVGNTADFPASGTAYIIDSANDRDSFTYTSKTATQLVDCDGVLDHTVSSTNKPLVIPAAKGVYISDVTNEMRFFGDIGSSVYKEIVSIGDNGVNLRSSDGNNIGVLGFNSYNANAIGITTTGGYRWDRSWGASGVSVDKCIDLFMSQDLFEIRAYSVYSTNMGGYIQLGATNFNIGKITSAVFTNRFTVDTYTGKTRIGENNVDNTFSTLGLTIDQKSYDDEILSFLSYGDITHGVTTDTTTATFGLFKKYSATAGGLLIRGITDTSSSGAIVVEGIIGSSDPTDSHAAVLLIGSKLFGTTVGALGALETVLTVQNRTTNLITVLGSGHVLPGADNTQDLGSATYRWANIYTADLHLKNSVGDWTLQEGVDDIFLINNKTQKKYAVNMTEIT